MTQRLPGRYEGDERLSERDRKKLKEAMYKLTEEAGAEKSFEIDKARLHMLMGQIKENQNLLLGIIGGIGGAVVGAVVWALVTALTGYQIGFMAVGIGFLVGIAVRRMGRGVDPIFGVAGAILALVGCLSGNVLAVCIAISRQESTPVLHLISRLSPGICAEMLAATFSPIDVLFYGIAVYEGYKFSFRRFNADELAGLMRE